MEIYDPEDKIRIALRSFFMFGTCVLYWRLLGSCCDLALSFRFKNPRNISGFLLPQLLLGNTYFLIF